MTYYAVIDTNILVSALLSSHENAATVQVVSRLFSNDVIPVFSDGILAEYNEVLPDMKDLPFYEVVLEKEADNAYLVTGNIKHFPDKSNIVTAREFLTILEA